MTTTPDILAKIADMLRSAGASVPAPENKGTIESAMATGLSIALCIIENEAAALAQGAEPECCPFCGGDTGHAEGCRAPVQIPATKQASETAAGAVGKIRLGANRPSWFPSEMMVVSLDHVITSLATPPAATQVPSDMLRNAAEQFIEAHKDTNARHMLDYFADIFTEALCTPAPP